MKKLLYYFIPLVFVGFIFFGSCEYTYIVPEKIEPPDTTVTISFDTTIVPIFSDRSCTNCHRTGGTSPDLTPDNAYASIVPDRVDLDILEESKIYTIPHPDGSHPQKYTGKQAQDVLLWIDQGAKDN